MFGVPPHQFRFIFLENFSDPSEWMASRLAFTRSVATTAIVGWVLGVGDRHAQNILIDRVSSDLHYKLQPYLFNCAQ